MWEVLLLDLAAFQCLVSASLPSPTSVFIASVNLRNVLEWTPGNDTPSNATFTVQYAIYGDSDKRRSVRWRALQRCTNTAQSWCDLSNQTRDLEEAYYARVRAESRKAWSGWSQTRRFDPKSDTIFGPPQMSVEVENSNAIVTVKGPMRYQPNFQMPAVSMATIYPHMMYNLSIRNTYRNKTSHFILSSGLYKHHLAEYNKEYCFSVKAKFLAMPVQCQSSEWQCITTPTDPMVRHLQWVVVSIVVPLVCVYIMGVTGSILYQYLMGIGQKTPQILDQAFSNQHSLLFPLERTSLNAITSISPADTMTDQRFKDPPPQYAVHLPQETVYNCDDRSIYGLVSATSHNGEGGNPIKHQKNHSSGVYAPQTMSSLQRPFHTRLQKHSAATAESSAPEQTAPFQSPLNVKVKMLKELGVIALGMEDKSQNELEPLFSGYAAQNTNTAFAAHSEQSEFRLADNEKNGDGHEEEEERVRGTIFIDWDPKSNKLVLPELTKWIYRENKPENGWEATKGAAEEENVMGGELLSGGVCVRQASDKEVLAPTELGRDPEGAGKVRDILTKWNLVIPMED
uniref:Helical cytokine receptor CRFB8 n=1 Tax=Tetraodon nigroviridis TaxID=99883 RepID=Q800G1_TETNG|nr:helical cytokine receptor CRFB8 [Tetraodon nigroviridis]